MELTGKVVVVTGGGSGIGEAIARAVAAEPVRHVVVADVDADQAERVAASIGGSAATVDVSDEQAVKRLVDETEDLYGPIGVFVSNAGYSTVAGIEDENDAIQRMWEVHCMAHIYAARAVLPSMIAQGGGYLLNTASAAGLLSQIGSMSYSITKAAAVSLAEWLAITHHHQGVRVSVLCPQAVRTNIARNSPDALERELANGENGIDRGVASRDGIVEPDHVARLCVDAIRNERFLILPHPEVATYERRKATDRDRWLVGMRRFQRALYVDRELPGDAIDPR